MPQLPVTLNSGPDQTLNGGLGLAQQQRDMFQFLLPQLDVFVMQTLSCRLENWPRVSAQKYVRSPHFSFLARDIYLRMHSFAAVSKRP
jgi:hypothetical protein